MIPVLEAAEPPNFAADVRDPGTTFLLSTPKPRSRDWKGHEYWRTAMDDLLIAYDKTCAYSGSWTYRHSGSGGSNLNQSSVDHFLPKSKYPDQAYEWSNYRLARARLNNRKADHEDILDPFMLQGRWFVLDFRSFLVLPNPILSGDDKTGVVATIARFGLNSDNDYVQERVSVVQEYCQGKLEWNHLKARWPFIAQEMIEQKFDACIRPNLSDAFLSPSAGP